MFLKLTFAIALIVSVQSASTNAPHLQNKEDVSNSSSSDGATTDVMTPFAHMANSFVPDESRNNASSSGIDLSGNSTMDLGNMTLYSTKSENSMGAHSGSPLGGAGAGGALSGLGSNGNAGSMNAQDDLSSWLSGGHNSSDLLGGNETTDGYGATEVSGSLQGYLDRLNKLATTVQAQLNRGITLLSRVGNQAPSQIPQAAATLQQYLHQLSNSVTSLQARINDAAGVVSRYSAQSPITSGANQMQEVLQQLRGFVAQG